MREQIISLGRRMQSAQTGFIHLNHQDPLGPKHDTIPVVENFLFALSLLRTRTSEQILEARELLHKLIPFQSPEGNFPIYLHDYPKCKELFTAAKILPILYWILKDFGAVVGTDVKTCARRLMEYCTLHQASAPAHIDILIAAGTDISRLEKYRDEQYWYSPTVLGCLIIALQMNQALQWPEFWTHLHATWHAKALKYAAPHFYDMRYQSSSFSHFYQLFMSGQLLDHPYSLFASLIQPQERESLLYPISKQGLLFEFQHTEDSARFYSTEGTPFQLLWVDGPKSHTLRLSAAGAFSRNQEQLLISMEPEQIEQFSLELDTDEASTLFINGERGTVFQLGDTIELATETKRVSLSIKKREGAGNVSGHLSLAPPEAGHTRKWVVSLRSVAVPLGLQVSLEVAQV